MLSVHVGYLLSTRRFGTLIQKAQQNKYAACWLLECSFKVAPAREGMSYICHIRGTLLCGAEVWKLFKSDLHGLSCQQVAMKYMSDIVSQKSCLLGRAGDCFFQMAKNWDLGRLMRFRAHLYLPEENIDFVRKQKLFYNEKFANYEKAKDVKGSRKSSAELWHLVNWELSTATFTLAISITADEATRIEVEKDVLDLLQKSLKLCNLEHPGSRQILSLTTMHKHLQTALSLLLKSKVIFEYAININNARESNSPNDELCKHMVLFENRLQNTLKTLIKLLLNGKDPKKLVDLYKKMSMTTLKSKCSAIGEGMSVEQSAQHFSELLQRLNELDETHKYNANEKLSLQPTSAIRTKFKIIPKLSPLNFYA